MENIKLLQLKTFGIFLALFSALPVPMDVLAAASYPGKPVRLVSTTAPGGGEDVFARMIAAKLTEGLGQQVIVENQAGGGGVIGIEMAAKAAPDGYTLLIASAKHTIQPSLEKLPYDPVKSFTPIARLVGTAYAFVLHPSVAANSVKEFIALAKQKPGQLIFGTSGLGATPHMAVELFKMMASIDIKIVHFKSAGPATIDLLGGHSHGAISSIPGLLSHIKSGKLRVLGTTGLKRSVSLPDVPTIAEAGLPGYEISQWYGVVVPAGTPAPIVDRLNREFKSILASEETKKMLLNAGLETDYLGSTEFGAFFEREIAQWANLIKKANIKLK